MNLQILDRLNSIAPSCSTQHSDAADLPEVQTFNDAYKVVFHPMLTSEMKKIFHILNRTIWTSNKQGL
jgi:hypothetical protein